MGISPAGALAKPNFEQRRQIILLRRQGLDVAEIARQVGIPLHSVGSYCRRQGWEVPDLPRLFKKNLPPGQQLQQNRLTVEAILQWADLYYQRSGVWPRWNSGAVFAEPGETWQQLDRALFLGTRGLPGRTTLLQLLRQNGRIIQRRDAWRSEEDALLGTMRDEDVAAQLGRTEVAVAARRRQLTIARYTDR